MTGDQCNAWCHQHPRFVRFYVPVVVTATFIAQMWEVFR